MTSACASSPTSLPVPFQLGVNLCPSSLGIVRSFLGAEGGPSYPEAISEDATIRTQTIQLMEVRGRAGRVLPRRGEAL